MTTFFSYLTKHKIPSRKTLQVLLTPPLTWYGFILYGLLASIVLIAYIFILQINNHFLVAEPSRGGTLTEGMIGAPQFINPLLATTETDTSLTKLLFAGLMRTSDVNGSVVPELAQSYTVSPDGLTYTFTLREKLVWSDHEPLVSDDVAYTIEKLADSTINPTGSAYWQNISVSTPTPNTVSITLPEPRSDFLSRMTIGIIPKHIWGSMLNEAFVTAPTNLAPVSSGMYTFRHIRTVNGIPYEIELTRNTRYALGDTYIDRYRMIFFANQSALLDALNAGDIDMTLAASSTTATALRNTDLGITPIPSTQTVTLFRNTTEPVLSNASFASVLNRAIDKNTIIATVEDGYGISPDSQTTIDVIRELESIGFTYRNGTLEKGGTPVGFSIGVENDERALKTAHELARQLGTMGIIVGIKAFDPGAFQYRLQMNDYQFVLIRKNDIDIPKSYQPVFILYTKTNPFITKKSIRIPIPSSLPFKTDRYVQALDWHVTVDNVWKPFSRTISNKQ